MLKKGVPREGHTVVNRRHMAKVREERREAGLCIDCATPSSTVRCRECGKKVSDTTQRYRRNTRLRVIEQYGGQCVCCGETEPVFLTFDHVNNDGAEHRRAIGNARVNMAAWLKKNEYPDTFQLLCWNCNAAKQLAGTCPHQGLRV